MRNTCIAPLLVGVFALAAIGCQDAATNPTAPETPALNFTNGPANPGNSVVSRYQISAGFLTDDPGRDLIAFHLAADDLIFCGGTSQFPVIEIQEVNTPAGIGRGIAALTDTPIFIYHISAFLDALSGDLCAFFADEWLYKGTHSLLIVGQLGAGPSFGWHGHGNVVDHSGASFRYRENQNAVVAKDGSVRWLNEDIIVR